MNFFFTFFFFLLYCLQVNFIILPKINISVISYLFCYGGSVLDFCFWSIEHGFPKLIFFLEFWQIWGSVFLYLSCQSNSIEDFVWELLLFFSFQSKIFVLVFFNHFQACWITGVVRYELSLSLDLFCGCLFLFFLEGRIIFFVSFWIQSNTFGWFLFLRQVDSLNFFILRSTNFLYNVLVAFVNVGICVFGEVWTIFLQFQSAFLKNFLSSSCYFSFKFFSFKNQSFIQPSMIGLSEYLESYLQSSLRFFYFSGEGLNCIGIVDSVPLLDGEYWVSLMLPFICQYIQQQCTIFFTFLKIQRIMSVYLQSELKISQKMKSVFKLYARTSKGNDPYLYQELLKFGIKPKYEELFHSFYFNATFEDIFKLSFNSLTVENLYLQLGTKVYLPQYNNSVYRTNQTTMAEFFKKIQFKNYIPIQRNLIQNITLKVFIRESSSNIPSDEVMGSILQNHLKKQIITKEYKLMLPEEERKKGLLENYYDMKAIVEKKWLQENKLLSETQALPLQQQKLVSSALPTIQKEQELMVDDSENSIPYSPHFVLYIRRNHARLLLKMNKKQLYKHGWKKKIGWGPIRESLTASILYRSGLIEKAKEEKQLRIWDPFCGSGTIPLVSCAMFGSINVRQDILKNFTWPEWSVFRTKYLEQFQEKEQKAEKLKFKVIGSDISLKTINSCLENFRQLMSQCKLPAKEVKQSLFKLAPNLNILQVLENQIYLGGGDFQSIGKELFASLSQKKEKINIITNLPYLNERSKEHHPINQLRSIYKRFNSMIRKYKENIANVFVIVGKNDQKNYSHFLNISTEEWRLLGTFQNGGIEIGLYGWSQNEIKQYNSVTLYQNSKRQISEYSNEKQESLKIYREQVKNINNKEYKLPKHLTNPKNLRGYKRVIEKRKARHLRAAYTIFSKRRDKNQAFEEYSRKELSRKLTKRGKTWKQRNLSLIGDSLLQNENIVKKQFQQRIESALKKAQDKKDQRREKAEREGKVKVKRKW